MTSKLIHIAALASLVVASTPTAAQLFRPDAETVAKQFAKADKNSDGKLTLDEAKAGMPRVAERFETLDKDKKGYVTLDQIQVALAAGGSK